MKKSFSLVILSVILSVAALCSVMFMTTASAAEESAKLSFADKAQRTTFTTSQQIWEQNGIKCINDKGSSTTNVGDYANPARFYAKSKLTIEAPGNITKIVVTCGSTTYANALTTSAGAEATASGSTVTIVPTNQESTSYVIASLSAQIRIKDITVSYSAAPACSHSNSTETKIDATCTDAGSITVTCNDCNEILSKEEIKALGHDHSVKIEEESVASTCTEAGVTVYKCSRCEDKKSVTEELIDHNYVDGSCTVCGEADPSVCAHANKTEDHKDPTKTQDGWHKVVCDDCGEIFEDSVLPATGCKVTFVVPNGMVAPSIEDGVVITIPEFDGTLPDGKYKQNYIFAGWAMSVVSDGTEKPVLYGAGDEVTLTDDTTFYAVYSYTEKGSTNAYTLSDISSISSGKVVITVNKAGTIYALSKTLTGKGAPTPFSLTVAGNSISSSVTDDIVWHFENDNGNLIFYTGADKTQWLYCINDNNGVRIGESAEKVFIIESGYLKNVVRGRYLGVYNTQDWRCYTSSTATNIANQTLGLYILEEAESYYTTNIELASCEHSYESEVTKAPTCTEKGVTTYTCSKCGESYTEEIAIIDHNYVAEQTKVPSCSQLGVITYTCTGCGDSYTQNLAVSVHEYVDGKCSHCGKAQPLAEITFGENTNTPDPSEGTNTSDGKALGASKDYIVIGTDGKEYTVTLENTVKVYGGAFDATGKACLKLGTSNDNASFTINVPDGIGKVVIYVAGYKNSDTTVTVNGVKHTITTHSADGAYTAITVYTYNTQTISFEASARAKIDSIDFYAKETVDKIDSASITAGEDLSLNYKVTLPEGDDVANYSMVFTMNGKTYTVYGVMKDGKAVFSFKGIGPQSICDLVDAELLRGDESVATKTDYSIKQYAVDFVAEFKDNEAYAEYITLLGDILAYGKAASEYTGHGNPDNFVVEGLTASDIEIAENEDRVVEETTHDEVGFTGAGVRFHTDNKIFVKYVIGTAENVVLKVNGAIVEAELVDGVYVFYTDGILASDFDKVYTFELVVGDEVVQTVKYSVNAYAFAKKDSAKMASLVLALYRYGASSEAIVNSAN